MSDLSDDEINQILETLAEQGIEYIMSKEDMKKILKNSAKKSSIIENNNEEEIMNEKHFNDINIEFSKVEEDTENSKINYKKNLH